MVFTQDIQKQNDPYIKALRHMCREQNEDVERGILRGRHISRVPHILLMPLDRVSNAQ